MVAGLWPDNPGRIIQPSVVATAVTDGSGSYELDASNTPAIAAAEAANGGFANFQLNAFTSSGLVYTWFFDAGQVGTPAAVAVEFGGLHDRGWLSPATGVVGTQHRIILTVGAPNVWRRPAALPSSSESDTPCNYIDQGSVGDVWAVVGEAHTWNGQHDKFSYGSTADSEMQTGIQSVDGKWGVAGYIHVGNSSSTGTTGDVAVDPFSANQVQAKFDRHQYAGTCGGHLRKATKWNGLDVRLGGATVPVDGNCEAHPAYRHQFPASESGWTRDVNTATTFTAGLDLGPLSVGVHSGYSTNVESHWTFAASGSHVLCGNDNGIVMAHRVFAGD